MYSLAIIRIRISSFLFCYPDSCFDHVFYTLFRFIIAFGFMKHSFFSFFFSFSLYFSLFLLASPSFYVFFVSVSRIILILCIPLAHSTFFVRCNSFNFYSLDVFSFFSTSVKMFAFFRFNFVVSHNLFVSFSFGLLLHLFFVYFVVVVYAAAGFWSGSVHVNQFGNCFEFGAMR